MASDGYLNFDTKINESGIEKGLDRITQKSKQSGKYVTQTAENTIAQVENIVNGYDQEVKISADTDSALYKVDEANQRIQAILNDTERSNTSKAASIASIYRQMGMDMSEAMKEAWNCIERGSSESGQSISDRNSAAVENASKRIKSSIKNVDSEFERSVNKNTVSVGESLKSLKSMLHSLAGTIGVALGVKELIETAASVNAANSQLEQTFKELKSTAVDAMGRVAKESGIVETRLHGVGTSIYAFAKASGMDSVQALSMMEDALRVTADSAAYYDRSLEDTSESLKSFLKGNFENDAALGLSCTETTRNAAANKMYARSFSELSEAQKQLVLLQMVQDANALSGAEGQAAREAEGWENVIGNLRETWKQLLGVVGQPVLKIATSFVKGLTAALAQLTVWAQAAYNSLAGFFGWEKIQGNSASMAAETATAISSSVDQQNALTDAVNETAKAQENSLAGFDKINKLSDSSDSSGKNSGSGSTVSGGVPVEIPTADTSKSLGEMNDFSKKVSKILKAVKGYFSDNFGNSWDGIWNGLKEEGIELYTTLKKIFSDIRSLGAPLKSYFLGDFTNYLRTAFETAGIIAVGLFDTFNKVFRDVWELAVFPILRDFITIGLPIITQFRTEFIKSLGTLFTEVKEIFDMLWAEAVQPVLTLIANIYHDLMESLSTFWESWGAPIFEKFRAAIEETGDALQNVWNTILKPVFDNLMYTIDVIWTGHLKPLIDNFLDFVGTLIDGALDIYREFILPVVDNFAKYFGPHIAAAFNFLVNIVGDAIGSIIDAVSGIITVLKGVVKFISGIFTGNWEKAWGGIKEIFKGIWDSLYSIVKVPINLIISLINSLINGVEDGLNWIIGGINSISFDVPDWVPGIGGKTLGFNISEINIPQIPHLAKGTVVPANYGEFLAVLGDNKRETEVVSPLSTIKQAVRDAAGEFKGGDINLNVNLDGKSIYRTIIKRNNESIRMTGRNPLVPKGV